MLYGVAEFDFEFSCTDNQQVYVDACLKGAKTRAHTLGCSWRVERLEDRTWRCTIHGQTRRLDLLGRALERDLPIVCEGVLGTLPPRRATALGCGFAELFLLGRDVDRGDGRQVLRELQMTSLYYPVYEFTAQSEGSERLWARLRVTENIVTDFGLGRVESVVVLEELHTATEQALRRLLPEAAERTNWPTLVDLAQSAGYLSKDSVRYRLAVGPDHDHTDRELLLGDGMNRRRNAAKHRGGNPHDPWVSAHWECLSLLLECLVNVS